MKKFYYSVLVILGLAVSGIYNPLHAQTTLTEQVTETETTEFNPHFFLQAQAGVGFTVAETSKFDKIISPAAAVNFGYRFSPLFGLRIGVSGWQGRGTWVAPRHDYKFNYLQGNVDAMLSLTNLFCGSNPTRTLDFYAFLGAGAAVGFHNKEAVDLFNAGIPFQKLWTGKHVFPAGRAGLGVDINLSRCFAINVEANANLLPDGFNSKRGGNVDWQFNGLVGITYNFGGRYKKKVTRTVEMIETVVVPEPVPEAPVTPAPKPEKKVVPAPMTQDIFFSINSSVITSEEKAKVDELIAYMKENPTATVTVTGYADKDTGTSSYNMNLSQARAAGVATMLEEAGIAQSRILVEAKGDTEQPFAVNAQNRVVIAVTK